MARGTMLQFPESGGALNQSPVLVDNMLVAWRTWYISAVKKPNEHTAADREFMMAFVFNRDGTYRWPIKDSEQ